jgi:hypothetical protein
MLRPLLCTLALVALALPARAAEPADLTIKIGTNAQLQLTAPKDWVRKQPKFNMIEHEFAAPLEGQEIDGRITIMGSGGEIQQNIDRWSGQFSQPDGKDSKDATKVTKKTVNGIEIHVVDISGTYKDAPAGPFNPNGGKAVSREDYRMLGAIIVAPKIGNYFVKFYGPAKTVAKYEADFGKMLDGLTVAAQ